VISPADVLLEYLHAQLARGITHVHLDQDTRKQLRTMSATLRAGKKSAASPPPPVTTAATTATPAAVVLDELLSATAAPLAAAQPLIIEGASRIEKLAALRQQAESWAAARALGSLRDVMVFATGNPEAGIMLIGEAPGYEEEKKLEPFVGPAGEQLDKILKAMGLARDAVYISNIVKFRPATARQTTNNRPPSPEEIAACLPLVQAEIAIIRPQCIIALGGSAAAGLLGQGGNVTSLRGVWHDFAGVPVRVTYHPSYLLRSSHDIQTKRMVWEDMLAVMELTGMPVSAKQRGFFLPKQ
jgi:uracil-DNA glycosylase family 4